MKAWGVGLGCAAIALGSAVGCSASDEGDSGVATGGSGNAAGDAGVGVGGSAGQVGEHELSFVEPSEGQVFTQTGLPASALIGFEVQAGAGIARVRYEIENDFVLGESTTPPSFALDYAYEYPGNRWARAVGLDDSGAQVAESLVNFVVQAPAATDCMGQLDALGVSYTTTVAKGVVDAVKLAGPLNGVLFASTDTNEPSNDPMACEFVLTLWKFADVLKQHGFVKIGGLGSYCYRCCCAWSEENYCRDADDPEPDCSQPPYSGYSNHSWGRALDVRWLYKQTGEVYDVNDPTHWLQWANSSDTCGQALAAQTGISKELYSLVCDARAQQVFELILTPNYNSAHRNHFHCDIGQSGVPDSYSVLSSTVPAVDATDHPDE